MNENERWDRVNQTLAAVGLSIGSSGIRGTLTAWEKLIGYGKDVVVTPADGTITITTTDEALRELVFEHSKRVLAAKAGKGSIDADKWNDANVWFRTTLTSGQAVPVTNTEEDNDA